MALMIPEWRGRPYRTSSKEDMKQYEQDKLKNEGNGILEFFVFLFGVLMFGLFVYLI